jgi:hypothetical protein
LNQITRKANVYAESTRVHNYMPAIRLRRTNPSAVDSQLPQRVDTKARPQNKNNADNLRLTQATAVLYNTCEQA